jgi:hypothetical protein
VFAYRSLSRHQPEAPHAALLPVAGGLAFISSYDAGLVAEFKARIPAEARSWDKPNRRWIVAPEYGQLCAQIAKSFLGVSISVPAVSTPTETTIRGLRIEYIGRCKERDGGEATASGYADGGWTVVLPESVLREWFEAVPQRPGDRPTLYAVLAVKPTATEDEVRKAHRRLARTWHPDVSREPDSAEQFKAIQHAYEVLSNQTARRKYDAGLALQASLAAPKGNSFGVIGSLYASPPPAQDGYRSPLRCGLVLAEGREMVGRFVVSSILDWQDVTDSAGRTMVTSWANGADKFTVAWQ